MGTNVTYELLHCRIAFIKPSTNLEDKSEIPQKPLILTIMTFYYYKMNHR